MPIMGGSRARVFCDAVHSILLQGYDDFELVVEDGDVESPLVENENVKALLPLFSDRFRYRCVRDRGIFDGLNKALSRATGEILYFFCSDDLLCPGSLVSVVNIFEQERFGGPFWLYGKTISADATGKTWGIDGEPTTYVKLLEHNRLGQPAVFWNRKLMNLAGMFDTRYRHAADYELWLRFWMRVEPMFLNQTLGIFRHHAGQNTNVQSKAVETEAQRISQRHRNFADLIARTRNIIASGPILETAN